MALRRHGCLAVLEPSRQRETHGRCELEAAHDGPHMIQGADDKLWWSTELVAAPIHGPWYVDVMITHDGGCYLAYRDGWPNDCLVPSFASRAAAQLYVDQRNAAGDMLPPSVLSR